MANSFMQFVKGLDAYPKTLEDFRERTFAGALVSFIALFLIGYLVISELALHAQIRVHPELYVDTEREEQLKINIDITFPKLPCGQLSVDAMDSGGGHQFGLEAGIFKQRLTSSGQKITEGKQQKIKSTVKIPEKAPGCGTCYGAESSPEQCCNTCLEVKEAYKKKGWAFTDSETVAQCIAEGFGSGEGIQKGEGCRCYGYLLVSKAQGNFHFAPGKSFQHSSVHVHDLQEFADTTFDWTHEITNISFGKEVGLKNPLDGVTKKWAIPKDTPGKPMGAMYQYFVKIVPTVYNHLNATMPVFTNQYSVTEHKTEVTDQTAHQGLPGVFVHYDLSPIRIELTEKKRSIAELLTSFCAIIGGVYTVFSIIDSFIHHGLKSLEKKNELGKAS